MVPGATAVAPYVVLANHYNSGLLQIADRYPAVYAVVLILAALAAGMILEDLGSMLEIQCWDTLIERETRCHTSDWNKFLTLATKKDEETVGHRYLRTLTLRLKFELSFGLALVVLWFGLIWLDAVMLLWREQSVLLLSALALGAAAYALWESYRTAWALGGVRHLILFGEDCPLEPRPLEADGLRGRFDAALVLAAVLHVATGCVLAVAHLWPNQPLEHRTGLVTAALFALFGIVMGAARVWLRDDDDAVGRRRGIALRLSLATALFAVFVQTRALMSDRPASPVTLAILLLTSTVMLLFAKLLWAGIPGRVQRVVGWLKLRAGR